ncbi:MAG: serine hydrolase [Eggerthellaceae bacterium]|nr:serine hydrolase [Eggerthellaceae bacterium]
MKNGKTTPICERISTSNRVLRSALCLMLAWLIACVAGCAASGGGVSKGTSADTRFEDERIGDVAMPDNSQSSGSAADAEGVASVPESSVAGESDARNEADEGDRSSNRELVARLTAEAQTIADAAGMQVGISVIDLGSNTYASAGGDAAIVSASMIKLPIAAAFLDSVSKGAYSLDDTYTLQYSDIVGGTGILAGYGAGAPITYRDLVIDMISFSDNTAANVLIRAIGMEAVNEEARALGLTATQLNRFMMDTEAISSGVENYTSSNDIAKLLKMIYEGTFVSPAASALVLQALEQQQDWGGILNGLPVGTVFAHKTGSLGNARHDGGIVEGSRPFVLVVLCGGEGFYEQGALEVMRQEAESAYAVLASSPA